MLMRPSVVPNKILSFAGSSRWWEWISRHGSWPKGLCHQVLHRGRQLGSRGKQHSHLLHPGSFLFPELHPHPEEEPSYPPQGGPLDHLTSHCPLAAAKMSNANVSLICQMVYKLKFWWWGSAADSSGNIELIDMKTVPSAENWNWTSPFASKLLAKLICDRFFQVFRLVFLVLMTPCPDPLNMFLMKGVA